MQPTTRPAWLPKKVWPFDTTHLPLDGGDVAVTDVGKGPALLLVHTGTWSFIWRDVMTRLRADYRCVCLDAPGTGQSTPRREVTLKTARDAVAAVIERLQLADYTLVVHDLGGIAGIAAAARRPDRVRGIVAVNTFGWKPKGAAFRGMLGLVGSAFMREVDVAMGLIPRIGSSAFGAGRHMDAESRRAYAAGLTGDALRAFHRYMHSALDSEDLYEEVARALRGPFRKLPLLTIFGERNDPLGFQPQWKALFPQAEQTVVAGGNHYPMCDDPDLVARTIRTWHRERVAAKVAS